jgi:Domain of unknown function (DUF4352)
MNMRLKLSSVVFGCLFLTVMGCSAAVPKVSPDKTQVGTAPSSVTAQPGTTPAPAVNTSEASAEGPTVTPTALPFFMKAGIGQRTLLPGLAVTVNKVELSDGPDNEKADDGNTWVEAWVTVENTGNDTQQVIWTQFDFLEVAGVLHNPRNPYSEFLPDSFKELYSLVPGGKVENKIVAVQLEKTLIKGLQLRFHLDNANNVQVDLGL